MTSWLMKVSRDAQNVYFYAQDEGSQSRLTRDPNWMMLFHRCDRNHGTGWEGYDYVVNRRVKDSAYYLSGAHPYRVELGAQSGGTVSG